VPRQSRLFIRKAIIEYPQRGQTADSLGEAEADDGLRYYIKGDAHERLVRASEWLSTHISEAVGIAAPAPAAIELIDGSIVFGSRRIVGCAMQVTTMAYLTTPTLTNKGIPATGLSAILSSIYVLDMFIHNDDRHLGNYLSVDDEGTRRLYAFDFSRALFWAWPWQGFPQTSENTRIYGQILRFSHGFDVKSAFLTLDRLSALAPDTIEGFINTMPSNWLPPAIRADFVGWWASNARDARIVAIRAGITNGTLL
jgi:hypothetical protein